MKPDPIIQPTSGNASPSNTSAKTVKSISGGGPNFSGGNATTKASPSPNNPYSKRG